MAILAQLVHQIVFFQLQLIEAEISLLTLEHSLKLCEWNCFFLQISVLEPFYRQLQEISDVGRVHLPGELRDMVVFQVQFWKTFNPIYRLYLGQQVVLNIQNLELGELKQAWR